MKFVIITILALSFGGLNAQENLLDKHVLDDLYFQAIELRIDLMLSSDYKYFELTENTRRIKDSIDIPVFKFLENEELIKKSIKERRTLDVYRVVHKKISPDTIDINFGQIRVTGKRKLHWNNGVRFKKAEFALSCGGTNEYQPDFRFVFDKDSKNWIMVLNRFVVKDE